MLLPFTLHIFGPEKMAPSKLYVALHVDFFENSKHKGESQTGSLLETAATF